MAKEQNNFGTAGLGSPLVKTAPRRKEEEAQTAASPSDVLRREREWDGGGRKNGVGGDIEAVVWPEGERERGRKREEEEGEDGAPGLTFLFFWGLHGEGITMRKRGRKWRGGEGKVEGKEGKRRGRGKDGPQGYCKSRDVIFVFFPLWSWGNFLRLSFPSYSARLDKLVAQFLDPLFHSLHCRQSKGNRRGSFAAKAKGGSELSPPNCEIRRSEKG